MEVVRTVDQTPQTVCKQYHETNARRGELQCEQDTSTETTRFTISDVSDICEFRQ